MILISIEDPEVGLALCEAGSGDGMATFQSFLFASKVSTQRNRHTNPNVLIRLSRHLRRTNKRHLRSRAKFVDCRIEARLPPTLFNYWDGLRICYRDHSQS